MAKNLLDQIISLASGSKWTKEQSENFEQSGAYGGLSGVEKYLQKKSVSTKTGVARYLEKKAQAEKEVTETAVEIGESSVEKYLKRKKGSSYEPPVVAKKASSVEKYLQQKELTEKQTPTAPAAKPAKPASGVDKYLRKQVERPAAKTDTKDPTVHKQEPKPVTKKNAQDKSSRCQATTSKGAQCSRTTSTKKIQRTINKKRQYFTVCTQHNNDSFKPFPDFVAND